jgi:hypothetical protein
MKDENLFVIFSAGWSEKFKRISSIELYKNESLKESRCKETNKLNNASKTDSGIHLGMSIENFESILPGIPIKENDKVKYRYEIYIKYAKPRILPWQRGQKFIVVGEWEYPSVKGIFLNNKLVRFSIWTGGEADFRIE